MTKQNSLGFTLEREVLVPERQSRVRIYRHRTGAEVVSVINDDNNKSFGVVFRTPPRNSTGIAHILEHSVLCGSRKYPVKEPFVELLKGSLKTFLNAFTYPDKTCYPVASQNERDFHNLVDVYLDAVFHPRITPDTLRQEGWHYELDGPAGPLSIKGVVYNEMKGVYSSPDSRFGEVCVQSLFPDTTYGFDSGGDPEVIPQLSFAEFARFHRTYYHPSNALFFFAGNDDPDARLRHLAEFLNEFRRKRVDASVPLQPPFPEPRRRTVPFAVEPGTPGADRGFAAVNWALPEPNDPVRLLSFTLLAHVLGGTPASPLYQALIESGLGEEVMSRLETQMRQMALTVGLRGIRPADAPRMERLIFDTLGRLAREGLHPELVEAALNTVEFQLRENNTGGFPRGLAMMLSAVTLWSYGGDPVAGIAFEDTLAEVKRRIAAEPDFFTARIRAHLLDNPHRTTVVLEPDADYGPRREREERERLEAIRKTWTAARAARVRNAAERLRAAQVRPDPPEALARIPTLQLRDLNPNIETYPCEETVRDDVRWFTHDLFTSGIVYLDLAFPLRNLPAALLPHVGILDGALLETGTSREDYAAFNRRIGRRTGGVRAGPLVQSLLDRRDATAWYRVQGKCLVGQIEDLCAIFSDALRDARFDHAERIRQMLLEEKAGAEAEIVPGGARAVQGRLAAQYTEAAWLGEQFDGLDQLFWLREATRAPAELEARVLAPLADIRARLFARRGAFVNITTAAADLPRVERAARDLLAGLPSDPRGGAADADWARRAAPAHESLSIPAQVNYVGQALDLGAAGYVFHGSALAIARYLNATWLWERVRVQGGAYGGFCRYDRSANTLFLLSYRDPNLEKTLEAFRGAAEFLRTAPISDDEVRKAIIGAIGELDAPLLPDAKGYASLIYRLIGLDDAERQRRRDEVLATGIAHFRAFGEAMAAAAPRIAVLGPRERVRAAPFPAGEPRRDLAVL